MVFWLQTLYQCVHICSAISLYIMFTIKWMFQNNSCTTASLFETLFIKGISILLNLWFYCNLYLYNISFVAKIECRPPHSIYVFTFVFPNSGTIYERFTLQKWYVTACHLCCQIMFSCQFVFVKVKFLHRIYLMKLCIDWWSAT